MIKALLFDFARVLLFARDRGYEGTLNDLNHKLSQKTDYDFLETFQLNMELMDFLRQMKKKVAIHMFTSETIQERPEVSEELALVFSNIYSAKKLGISKTEPGVYKMIALDLKLAPGEIVFIDDNLANINAAVSAGMIGIQYLNNDQILTDLQQLPI